MVEKNIGVLSLQGAIKEHLRMIENCGACGIPVKRPDELSCVDALIIPGGESTTIGILMLKYGFMDTIRELCKDGMPIYGTCAGLILLAKRIRDGDKTWLDLMDVEVRRNAFGRQRESFEANLDIPDIGEDPFAGVFIRAPWIESVGKGVNVMSKFEDKIVMARQGKILVSAFHPELTRDMRIHSYFIEMIKKS